MPYSIHVIKLELYNHEELHSLYRSPKIFRVIKSKTVRWAGHIDRMKKTRSAFKMLTGKPTGEDVGLSVNTGKAKCMELGHQRGIRANEHIRIGSKVKIFK